MRHYLNSIILALAPRHEPREHAPATWQELAQCKGRLLLPVWDGASDKTWFRDAKVNHAFRAWHDAAHLAGEFPFTLEGERKACELQCAQLLQRWPRADALVKIIRAEVIGQAEYFAAHGFFPINQEEFINNAIGQ